MEINRREFKSITQEQIDISDIAYVIKKAIGDHVKISRIDTSKGGDINSSYVIHTSNPNEKFYLKVENHHLITQFHAGQIEREEASIRRMKAVGVPCPTIISYDKKKSDIGKNYLLTEYIDAPLLCEVWGTLSQQQKTQTKRDVFGIVNQCKSIKNANFGDVFEGGNRGKHALWKDAYKKLGGIIIEDCSKLELFNSNELAVLDEAIKKSYVQLNQECEPCYCHMDLHWENMLVAIQEDKLEIKAVLDYGNSMFGTPITDECRLFTFFLLQDEFYDAETPLRIEADQHSLFASEFIYGLEIVLFEGIMGQIYGGKEYLFSKCDEYLDK